jgi:hypothetical protein
LLNFTRIVSYCQDLKKHGKIVYSLKKKAQLKADFAFKREDIVLIKAQQEVFLNFLFVMSISKVFVTCKKLCFMHCYPFFQRYINLFT